MAVLKNRTQGNFTMISNCALRDKKLGMFDRGLLSTICSLPDEWEFSVRGLAKIVPDGADAISASVKRLEQKGYLIRNKTRDEKGKFISEVEVFTESRLQRDMTCEDTRTGSPVTDYPSRVNQYGATDTANPRQYNTHYKKRTYKTDDIKSINQPGGAKKIDGRMDSETKMYQQVIADNIALDDLLAAAKDSIDPDEIRMVQEIYSFICDVVCYPREGPIRIKGVAYPWETVKKQFLKLKYEHVASVLNRILDEQLNITRMDAYLMSSLYSASLLSTLTANAQEYDDYLKYNRGNPYM